MFQQKIRFWLLIYLIFHVVLTVITTGLITRHLRRDAESELLRQLAAKLDLVVDNAADTSGSVSLEKLLNDHSQSTNLELAIVSSDAQVIASSTELATELELTRPEVVQARDAGRGSSFRLRSKPEQRFGCVTRKVETESSSQIFWISEATDNIDVHAGSTLPFVWGFSVMTAVCVSLLALMFDRAIRRARKKVVKVARSIGKTKYESVQALHGNEDWFELRSVFTKMATKIRKRERSLKSGQHRSEIVLGSMIEGVLAINPTGSVMLINPAAESMLGLEGSETEGRKLLDLIRIPELTEAVERTQLSRVSTITEIQTWREPKRTLSVRVAPLENPHKPGVAVVLQDVTELRSLERVRTDFVANVSHELKTPLASIRAYAETLKLGAINDKEKGMAFVEQIEKAADMLNSQIQDLLELARVESGKASFTVDNVRLNEVAGSCVERFAELARVADVKLNLETESSDPIIIADSNSVQVILTNLVSNAITYTPAGGTVTVKVDREQEYGVVSVIDDGIGIGADHQNRVFERFYRVDRARSREAGGTGLGLAIVKHLTQSFDGTVKLTSQIGKGSTFEVRFHLV